MNTRQKRQVKRIINTAVELKYLNIVQPQLSLNTTPNIQLMTNLGQGTTDNTRIGDRAQFTSLHMKLFGGTGTATEAFCRFMIFQWKPFSVPTAAQLLLLGTGGVENLTSQLNHDFRSQYKVLYDRTFNLIATADNQRFYTEFTVIPKQKNIGWNAATSAAGSGTGLIYFMIVSDQDPYIYFTAKLHFRDA